MLHVMYFFVHCAPKGYFYIFSGRVDIYTYIYSLFVILFDFVPFQTDVIVNTVSPTWNLNDGEISKAVLKKAGTRMQKDIHMASLSKNFITTNSYNLNCKEVYHICCGGQGNDTLKQV